MNTNENGTFRLQKCGSNETSSSSNSCTTANSKCISTATRTKKVLMCVPDANVDGKAKKVEFDYVEDEACLCEDGDGFVDGDDHASLINVTRAEYVGTCRDACQPKDVRIRWRDLKTHLNHWTYLHLSPHFVGRGLKVKKCRQNLTPCPGYPDRFCDVVKEQKSKKTVRLRNADMKLIIKVFEASECDCKEAESLTYDLGSLKEDSPPTITSVKISKAKRKRRAGE